MNITAIVEPIAEGVFRVKRGRHVYLVRPAEPTCECPGFRFEPTKPCPHLQAVWAYELRQPRPQRPGAPVVPVGP